MESIEDEEDMTMKNYTITVNGNVYDVTVEEKNAGPAPLQDLRHLQNLQHHPRQKPQHLLRFSRQGRLK